MQSATYLPTTALSLAADTPAVAPSAQALAQTERPRILGLDLLRASAILMVLTAHGLHLFEGLFPKLKTFKIFAYYGVELFFVISGFLIGNILLEAGSKLGERATLQKFFVRRWWRTLPNYYLFCAINYLIFAMLSHESLHFHENFSYLFFLQNFWKEIPEYFSESWSLSIEEWFYLLFPLSLFIGLRLKHSFNRVFLLSAALFLILPLLARIFYFAPVSDDWGDDLRKIVLARLDAFGFALLVAYGWRNHLGWWQRHAQKLLYLGLGILLVIAILFNVVNLDRSVWAKTLLFTIVSFGFACLLPYFAQLKTVGIHTLDFLLGKLARWSYSIYLCNLPVFTLVHYFGKKLLPAGITGILVELLLYLTCTLLISSQLYRHFERPLMSKGSTTS